MKKIYLALAIFSVCIRLLAQSAEGCPPYQELGPNVFAGIDIGSVGIKPVVVEIEPNKQTGKVVFRKISMGLESDNAFDLGKDRSPQTMRCYAQRLQDFVAIFKSPMYNLPPEKIYLLMSSGFLLNFKDDPEGLERFRTLIALHCPGVSISKLTAEQESEYIVQAVSMDEGLDAAHVTIIDVGGRTLKGGHMEGGKPKCFSISTGPSGLGKELDQAMSQNGLDLKNEVDRRQLMKTATEKIRSLVQDIQLGAPKSAIVLGGGISYVYSAWVNPQDVANRPFNKIFPSNNEVDYFAQEVLKYCDVNPNQSEKDKKEKKPLPGTEDLFKRGSGEANIYNYQGRKVYKDAQTIYAGTRMLAGAAILQELVKDLRKKGAVQFVFNSDMQYSHLYYHIYLRNQ